MKLRRGFTLIEVVVALAIVSVGIAALLLTLSQSVRTSSYLLDKTLAQWIALNKITETRVNGTIPTSDKSDGEIEYGGRRWRWELEKIATPVKGIVRLESRVAQSDAPEDNWVGQATSFMGTAIAPPGSQPPLNWSGNVNSTGNPGPGQNGDEPGQPQRPGQQPPPGQQPIEPGEPGTQPPPPPSEPQQ